jgi:16S rRNA (guanine527-N7)-methyltransferase
MTPHAALRRGLGEIGLALPPAAEEKLLAYRELLEKWNRTYNLTAIRDPVEMVTHHLLDSLAVIPPLSQRAPARLADVGSGSGAPGIPIAIARPGLFVALNDASEKKAAFLRQVAIELDLRNVAVQEGRVEAWRPAEGFAVVISRAFADLAKFIRACRHLLAEGGELVSMKGVYPEAELAQAPKGWTHRVVALSVPMLGAQRHLVFSRIEERG